MRLGTNDTNKRLCNVRMMLKELIINLINSKMESERHLELELEVSYEIVLWYLIEAERLNQHASEGVRRHFVDLESKDHNNYGAEGSLRPVDRRVAKRTGDFGEGEE